MKCCNDDAIRGTHLRIASVELQPWVEFLRDENGSIIDGQGFCFEIIKALRDCFNFTFTIEKPEDNAYGALLPNGSWTGMIDMILGNVSDIAVGSFSLTYPRFQVIDFTRSYYEESSAILIPAPIRDQHFLAVAKPFSLQLWIMLLVIMSVVSFIIWIPSSMLTSKCRSSARLADGRLLFVYGVLFAQSGLRLSFGTSYSSRVVAGVWCLSAVVFTHAYVGMLISFLSVPTLKPLLATLEELPASGLRWTVWKGTDLDSLFTDANEGLYRRIGDGLRQHPEWLIESPLEGPRAVIKGSYANMNSKSYLEWKIEEDYKILGECRLSLAKETFYKIGQAFVLPKGSPLKAIIDHKILQMLESGLMDYWRLKHHAPQQHCIGQRNQARSGQRLSASPRHLTIEDLQSAFFVWFVGIVLAFIAFIAEHLVKRLM